MLDLEATRREETDLAEFISNGTTGPLIKNVSIFRTGDYSHKGKGKWTAADLQEIVRNFNMLSKADELHPPVKSTHENDNRGRPVLGWVEGVRVKGNELLADFRAVSEKIKELIASKGLRFRSAELHSSQMPYIRPDGTKLANVLRGFAFVPVPEVKGLPEIEFASYSEDGDPVHVVNYQEDISMKYRNQKSGEIVDKNMAGAEGWEPYNEAGKAATDDAAKAATDAAPDAATDAEPAADAAEDKDKKDEPAADADPAADAAPAADTAAVENTDAAGTEDHAAAKDDENDKTDSAMQEAVKIECPECGKEIEIDVAGGECPECEAKLSAAAVKKALDAMKAADKAKATKAAAAKDAGAKEAGAKGTGAAEKYGKPKVPFTASFDDARAAVANLSAEDLQDLAANALVNAYSEASRETASWVDEQVKAGRVTPAQRDMALKLAGPVARGANFSDEPGDNFGDVFRKLTEASTPQVNFRETAYQHGPDAGQSDSAVELDDATVQAEVARIKAGKAPGEK